MPQAANSRCRSDPVLVGGSPPGFGVDSQRVAPGIDHHHQPAAAHHELVDCVLRRFGQVLRVGHQQHLDVGRDHLRIQRHRFHRVGLAQQHGGGIGLTDRIARHALAHRHHHELRVAIDRQRRHHADHRARRVGQLINQLRQVVFQETFAVGLEEGDGALVVQQVGAGQAEIDFLAGLIERDALQPVGQRSVFGAAERLGVVDFELQLAAGAGGVFLQHLPHMVGVRAIGRHRRAERPRIEQAQGDRFLQPMQDRFGTGRQRVDVALRQVRLRPGEPRIGEQVDADHHRQHADHPGNGRPCPVAHRYAAFRLSTITAFRNSQNPMNVAKNTKSRALMIPRVKSWNRSSTASRRAIAASTGICLLRKSVTSG